jgi:ferredoxin
MRLQIRVDMNECQDHGQCVLAAPETFRFGAGGRLEYDELVETDSEQVIGQIEDAADICPLQAIVVERFQS